MSLGNLQVTARGFLRVFNVITCFVDLTERAKQTGSQINCSINTPPFKTILCVSVQGLGRSTWKLVFFFFLDTKRVTFSPLKVLQAAPEPGGRGGKREEHGLRALARPRAAVFAKGDIPVGFSVLQPGETGADHGAVRTCVWWRAPASAVPCCARGSADDSLGVGNSYTNKTGLRGGDLQSFRAAGRGVQALRPVEGGSRSIQPPTAGK